LDALPGIGPVLAQRIIAYREQRKREGHRGFESKDELLNVPGIGPKRYTAVRALVSL
jgi:competence protein ComEA